MKVLLTLKLNFGEAHRISKCKLCMKSFAIGIPPKKSQVSHPSPNTKDSYSTDVVIDSV